MVGRTSASAGSRLGGLRRIDRLFRKSGRRYEFRRRRGGGGAAAAAAAAGLGMEVSGASVWRRLSSTLPARTVTTTTTKGSRAVIITPTAVYHLVLSLYGSGSTIDTDAFAWVCKKFYEYREPLEMAGVDCFEPLRRVVVQLCNTLPADPGIHAATARWSPEQQRQFESLLPSEDDGGIRGLLEKLDKKGFVVIDCTKDERDNTTTTTTAPCPLTTSVSNQNKLSTYLAETTGQGDAVRTDRVHFLSRPQAVNCGIAPQYDLLMGLAHYLNHHQDQPIPRSECLQPIAPATTSRQLTVPRTIQFAEYGANDFYTVRWNGQRENGRTCHPNELWNSCTHSQNPFFRNVQAHSDNSLTDQFTRKDDRIRRNFRAYVLGCAH